MSETKGDIIVRILLGSITLLLAVSVSLAAQDSSKSEFFGGYQFFHLGNVVSIDPFTSTPGNPSSGINANGWDAAYTYKINKAFGIAGDFGGAYGSATVNEGVAGILEAVKYKINLYTYAFGPVYSFDSKGNLKPFVHFLAGGAHASGSACPAGSSCTSLGGQSGFVMETGGGLDLIHKKSLSYRIFQFDWVYRHIAGQGEGGNVRLSTGILFRF